MSPREKELAWALGIGAAVVGAWMFWTKKSAAAATVAPTVGPPVVQLPLQPGATSVVVAKGGTVTLILPTGGSWSTATTTPIAPLPGTAVQPTGTMNFSVVMPATAGNYPLGAAWTDSNGNPQTTLLNISAV